MCEGRKILDETAVEVTKTEEGLYILQRLRGRPICDAVYFCLVHLDLAFGNNNPEVFDASLIEKTLFGFQEKVVALQAF